MAYTTINKSGDYFNTVLYDGNSTARNITTGFEPAWVWIKSRSNADHHQLFDSVRGAGYPIYSSTEFAQGNNINALSAFNSDSFSLGTDIYTNGSGKTYASWNWKANGAGSSNTDGSITSTVSANTTSGFSVVSYTGSGSSSSTIGHGLGEVPKMIILKNTSVAVAWQVYHHSLGNGNKINLNLTSASSASSNWNNTSPTSSVFSVSGSGSGAPDASGENIIAYCFAEVPGYSKFGSYTGNGNADGTFVYTGFKPAWVMRKYATGGSAGGEGWEMLDSARSPSNVADERLKADSNNAESTGSNYYVDFLSNGFKCRTADNATNNSGATYIYMAFAEAPLVGTNNVPANAR